MMGCLNGKLDKENEDEKSRREANKKIEKQLQKDKQMYRATHRLLLLGNFIVSVLFLQCTVYVGCGLNHKDCLVCTLCSRTL